MKIERKHLVVAGVVLVLVVVATGAGRKAWKRVQDWRYDRMVRIRPGA